MALLLHERLNTRTMDKPRSPVQSDAEERLRENEQRLAGILNSEDMFVCRVDLLFRLTYMNEAFANAFAVGIGDATWPMVHPDDEERSRIALAGLQNPPYRCSIEVRNSIRGEWRWVRWTNSIIRDARGVPVEVQGVGIDITERKRAEASLRESNALLVAAERLAGVGGFRWNIATDAVVWSEEVYRNFGRDIKEGAPTLATFIATIHSDDRLRVQDAIIAAVAGTRQYNVEYRIVRPDGSERIIHSRGEVARDQAGKAVSLTGASHDITQRKQVEDKLRRSEERFRSYFELGLIGMAVTLPNGGIAEVNDKMCEILGYERAELLEKTWQELTHPEDLTADLANFDSVLAGDIDGYTLDKRFIRKDGAVVYTTIAVRCLRTVDRAVDHFVAFLQDITERKRAEETLRSALVATIEAMAATVEARDPYTAGHQQRVADLAAAIARDMGLPATTVEGIHFGALIHDLGKIQIPAEILTKPIRLTPPEFELIKTHPQAGYEIVKGIKFPWPVAEMVHQHHERLDGSGYPQGLKGESIALEARILAVADVVESMATDRPYRMGLGIDAALREVEGKRGTLYDRAAVDACLRLFSEKRYSLRKS